MNRYLFILILIQFQYNFIFGQNITGKITFDNDIPAAGVSVLVKGTSTGTISDINGKYQITVDSINKILCFAYLGFERKEIITNKDTIINLRLEKEPFLLKTLSIQAYIQPGKKELIVIKRNRKENKIDTISYSKDSDPKVLEIEKKWENVNLDIEWSHHIFSNIDYPDTTILTGIEDKIYIKFVIDDLGYLNELEIIRGIDILGIVVLNAIKSMPKWNMTKNYMYMTKKPGSYILPVLFKIIEKE